MQLLMERYWALAVESEIAERDLTIEKSKRRFYPHRMAKGEDEYRLMDRVVEIIDRVVQKQKHERSKQLNEDKQTPAEKFAAALDEHRQIVDGSHGEHGFRRLFHASSFQVEADKIRHQIR